MSGGGAIAPLILNPQHIMEISSQLQALAGLTLLKNPGPTM